MLAFMSLRERLAGALKPEYLFQPKVVLRRLTAHHPNARGKKLYDMPGRLQVEAEASEEHGRMLATLGVIDLPVTEALWRLTEPGETCADVGANIGYMTGILAARARGGTVHAFEAMPEIFAALDSNVARFRELLPNARIETHAVAVSDHTGSVRMEVPDGSDKNHGLARVADTGGLEVKAVTLDEVFAATTLGVMKLDVEGHELAVLKGAERLFREKRVRDCVFEEHRGYPSEVTTWFEDKGYRVLKVLRAVRGPTLVDGKRRTTNVAWLPQSFLATCDVEHAQRMFAARGWSSLR